MLLMTTKKMHLPLFRPIKTHTLKCYMQPYTLSNKLCLHKAREKEIKTYLKGSSIML